MSNVSNPAQSQVLAPIDDIYDEWCQIHGGLRKRGTPCMYCKPVYHFKEYDKWETERYD